MAYNDNLRTLLHEADNDVRESFAADVLRQVGGNLDQARQLLGIQHQAPAPTTVPQPQAGGRPPVTAANPMLQSFAFSEAEVTPELIALQKRELERLEQERLDRELAQRLGGADGAAAAEAERQAAAALSAEAERQRRAAEAERQRQAAAAAEAERQRQLQYQQLEAERQRQATAAAAAAIEAERQRAAEIERLRQASAAAEAERQRQLQQQYLDAERQRQAAAVAVAEAERQRLLAAEVERQRQAAAVAAAEAERQLLALEAERQRQRLAAEAEQQRLLAAEAEAEAERQRAAAAAADAERQAAAVAAAAAERQRAAAAAAEVERQAAAVAAVAAEAERQRTAAAAAVAEADRQRLAAEEADRQRLNEAQLLENITVTQAKLRADQERVNALASHEKECALMHESMRIDVTKLNPQSDSVAVDRMQEQLRALEQQLDEARRAHQAARDEADRERLRIQAVVSELRTRASRPPKVSIFVCPGPETDTAQVDATVGELRTLLLGNGVLDEEITVIDVSNDREQACFIQQKLGREVAYPVVSVLGQPIGNLEALNKLVHDGQLQAVLNGTPYESATPLPTQSGPANHGQGVLDVCLDAVEYIGSTVTSVVAAPFWLLSYPFRSHAKCELPKGPNDIDFDVVHTNWYWRNQKRKFRFYDDEFVRIHPTHMDIRATHKYATIGSIRRFDSTSMCISYNDSSSPDWIVATEDDVSAIIEVIRRKSKRSDLLVVNVSELSA